MSQQYEKQMSSIVTRKESPLQSIDFLQGGQNNSRIVFSTNGAETIKVSTCKRMKLNPYLNHI